VATAQKLPPEELLVGGGVDAIGISGRATDHFSHAPVSRLVFVSDNKIVGYGASIGGFSTAKKCSARSEWKLEHPAKRNKHQKNDSDKWLGFSRQPRTTASVDAYALENNADSACHLATVELPQR
jgi:hypothetical protein